VARKLWCEIDENVSKHFLELPVGYDKSFIGHPLHSYRKCGGQSLMMVGPLRSIFGRIYAWKYCSCWYNHFICCLYI